MTAKMMQGYNFDGTQFNGPGSHHAGVHEYSPGCGASPTCRPADNCLTGQDDCNYQACCAPKETEVADEPKQYITKDSGQRQDYASGMRRDVQDGKPNFGLIFPEGVAYEDQFLTRFAGLLERGAVKYGDNNWQLANSQEELTRFRASALRHAVQWACGETDEDHAAAVVFNLMAYETTKRKVS